MRQVVLRLRSSLGKHLPTWMIRRLVIAEDVFLWLARIRPKAPPHPIKVLIVRRYRRRYRTRTFIETGTYLGDMVAALHHLFDRVISLELSPELHARAQARLRGASNVELHCGDSGRLLPRLLQDIPSSALFWLDAHFSGGVTAKGELDSPIVQEMQAILDHPVKSHVILIDDARTFRGVGGYPTIEQLELMVRDQYPNARFRVRNNIVRITPRARSGDKRG